MIIYLFRGSYKLFFFLLSSASWLLLCLQMFIFLDLLMIIFHSFCSFPFLFSLFLHSKVLFTSCWSLLQLHLVFKLGFYRWGTCFSCIYIYTVALIYVLYIWCGIGALYKICAIYTHCLYIIRRDVHCKVLMVLMYFK